MYTSYATLMIGIDYGECAQEAGIWYLGQPPSQPFDHAKRPQGWKT